MYSMNLGGLSLSSCQPLPGTPGKDKGKPFITRVRKQQVAGNTLTQDKTYTGAPLTLTLTLTLTLIPSFTGTSAFMVLQYDI